MYGRGRLPLEVPCQIFGANDGLPVPDGILRSRTICDLVRSSAVLLSLNVNRISRWVLTAWGPYRDLSVEDMLAADRLDQRSVIWCGSTDHMMLIQTSRSLVLIN